MDEKKSILARGPWRCSSCGAVSHVAPKGIQLLAQRDEEIKQLKAEHKEEIEHWAIRSGILLNCLYRPDGAEKSIWEAVLEPQAIEAVKRLRAMGDQWGSDLGYHTVGDGKGGFRTPLEAAKERNELLGAENKRLHEQDHAISAVKCKTCEEYVPCRYLRDDLCPSCLKAENKRLKARRGKPTFRGEGKYVSQWVAWDDGFYQGVGCLNELSDENTRLKVSVDIAAQMLCDSGACAKGLQTWVKEIDTATTNRMKTEAAEKGGA